MSNENSNSSIARASSPTKIQAQVASFQSAWTFNRSLSFDLLAFLSPQQLLWTPGKDLGAFWKQFRHMGRVQENYLTALDTGSVKFSTAEATYKGNATGCNHDTTIKHDTKIKQSDRAPNASDASGCKQLDTDADFALLEKDLLLKYLNDLDSRMAKRLASGSLPESIDWFGEPVGLGEHLFRLDSHETLHQGQLIVYCQLLGCSFPESWSIWGLQ